MDASWWKYLVLVAVATLILFTGDISKSEVAAPVHCSLECNDDFFYSAGDRLKGCFGSAGSLCGMESDCGEQGEDCPSCCESYCENAGIREHMSLLPYPLSDEMQDNAVSECITSCKSQCKRSKSAYALKESARMLSVVVAALILALCSLRLILSDDPVTRTAEKKCVVLAIIALVVILASSEAVDLFYKKPTDAEAKPKPYIDLLEVSIRPADTKTFFVRYRSSWVSAHNVEVNLTCDFKRSNNQIEVGNEVIGCKNKDSENVGDLAIGEVKQYSGGPFCCDEFKVSFSAKEGIWSYDVDCSFVDQGKCELVGVSFETKAFEDCFDGKDNDGDGLVDEEDPDCKQHPGSDCSQYDDFEKCESSSGCWWNGTAYGSGECLSCGLITDCEDYPARNPDDENLQEGRCPLCNRNPCDVAGGCVIAIDYPQDKEYGECSSGQDYWNSFSYKCERCDLAQTCYYPVMDSKGVNDCSDYEVPSSCSCNPCIDTSCWTKEYVDITVTSQAGEPATEGSSLELECEDITVTGEIIRVDGREITFRITKEKLNQLKERGCTINGL